MAAHEVITVQCGHFSNFIGTHYWNLQEVGFCYDPSSHEPREILHDCTFREGLTLTGEQTYTPRLIAIDLSGSLKTLREHGVLYGVPADKRQDTLWAGETDVHVAEPPEKNEFLSDLDKMEEEGEEGEEDGGTAMEAAPRLYPDLDSSVEVWSDFLRLHLHPKTLLTVPGHFHSNGESTFDTYPAGQQVWEKMEFRHELEDRLHFFAEECDHLQGFHILSDWNDGFGAVACALAQEIRDEFGDKGILSVPVSPLAQPMDELPSFRPMLLNNALTLEGLLAPSSLISPLSLLHDPWRSGQNASRQDPAWLINYKAVLPFHSSALMASALETVSLLYRTEQSVYTLPQICDALTPVGRKVCNMGVCLPLHLPPGSSLMMELDRCPLPTSLLPLSPFCSTEDVRWAQAVAVRGIPPQYPMCHPLDARSLHCRHPSLAMAAHLADQCPDINSLMCMVQKPLCVNPPFPTVLPSGYYDGSLTPPMQVPMAASLHSQSGLHLLLSTLLTNLRSTNPRLLPLYASSCLDQDGYQELLQTLGSLTERYQTSPNTDSSTDSD